MLKHCYSDVHKIQYKGWGQVKHEAKSIVLYMTQDLTLSTTFFCTS